MAIKSIKDLELKIKATNETGSGFNSAKKSMEDFASSAEKTTRAHSTQVTAMGSSWSNFSNFIKNTGSTIGTSFSNFASFAKEAALSIYNVGSAIVEVGIDLGKMIVKAIGAFAELNGEFEKMKVTLDVVTKGRGEEWFNKLNNWALNMPVSMSEVTKSFTVMRAYGLEPTTQMMQTLIDTASVLPDSGRAISGIARAMGQITAKGRLEGQELRQLAEWAVPGYEAVYTKIFKKISEETGVATSKLKFTMIDAATANKAILETMKEHFGGAAAKIAGTWEGMTTRIKNYTKEAFRELGESGLMQPLTNALKGVLDFVSTAFSSGEFQKTFKIIGWISSMFITSMIPALKTMGSALWDIISIMTSLSPILAIFKVIFNTDDMHTWGDVFINTLAGIIKTTYFLTTAILGIKWILLLVKDAILYFGLAFNGALYGVIWLIDKVIKGIGYLINLIPDMMPGAQAIKNAYKGIADFTSGIAEAQGQNVVIMNGLINETNSDITKTMAKMAAQSGLSDAAVKQLIETYKKLQAETATPLKTETGGEMFGPANVDQMKIWEDKLNEMKDKGKLFQSELFGRMGVGQKIKVAFELVEAGKEKDPIAKYIKAIKDMESSISSGLSSTFQSVMQGNMNLADSFTAMGKVIRDSFFKILADMAAEWIMTKTIMLGKHIFVEQAMTTATAVGTEERTALESAGAIKSVLIAVGSAIKRITIYAYEAAAGAFKAMVGIPYIGPFLAVGAGALALATVLGFAKHIAGFEKGTGLEGVGQTGPAVLHKGEIVLNRRESDAYREGVKSGGGVTSPNVNLSFNISSMDSEDMERVVRKKVIPLIRDNIRDFGKGRTMIKEAMS